MGPDPRLTPGGYGGFICTYPARDRPLDYFSPRLPAGPMSGRGKFSNHPYGTMHKVARKRFAARMRAGEVFFCWRPSCPTPDVPIDPRKWDLGHVDPELRHQFGGRHPEHRSCNRATVTHLKQRLQDAGADVGRASREW